MTLYVTRSEKDDDGDIIGLYGPSWRHSKAKVIVNIMYDSYAYAVTVDEHTTYVRIGSRNSRAYLTTNPDAYGPNNLDTLEDC